MANIKVFHIRLDRETDRAKTISPLPNLSIVKGGIKMRTCPN